MISIIFFWFIYFFYTDSETLKKFPTLTNNLESVLLVTWSVVGFLTINPQKYYTPPLSRVCFFWICTAILIYFNGTFFLDGFYNLLKKKISNAQMIYQVVHAVFNYIFYILVTWGFINTWRIQKYYKPF